MNAVEIEEAVSALASAPFDPAAFPYAFLTAFGVKETTIARLRKGDTNASDMGGVLQRGNIHIAVAQPGAVNAKLRALRESPKTVSAKAKFILATDGEALEAEDLVSGEPLACAYPEIADHFGFFLPLAGISTVKELKNNPIDVKATGRLNRLYVELLKENVDWGTPERRHDLNQFMARLIFCFFAEDTAIFSSTQLFTSTIEQMSTTEAGSVEHVLTELFRAMDIKPEDRAKANLRSWADKFPYVNGGLFAGGKPCPRFSRVARSYLLRAGELNWREINPDIFGSMIQAVADDSERGSLGMHYTSVPNIMKVLGPLFLDDIRAQLEAAGDNIRKLRNLRKRLANIRVFDPACGSGNFLVIAYIRMREIEHEIIKLTDDEPRSVVPLSNFYGIEIKDFAAEIARLALLIAEFQCDVRFINQQVARSLVLPLKRTGHIKTGNALRENWLDVCPPIVPTYEEHDLGGATGRLALEGNAQAAMVETFICGNPPYKGSQDQTKEQKADLERAFGGSIKSTKSADYVSGWFIKAKGYIKVAKGSFAFVATNSIHQGRQVALYWPAILGIDAEIIFAVPSFQWRNLAAKAAIVTVSVIGISLISSNPKRLYTGDTVRSVKYIGPYLVPDQSTIIEASRNVLSDLSTMDFGSMPNDGGGLLFDTQTYREIISNHGDSARYFKKFVGSDDSLYGKFRYCLWLSEQEYKKAAEDSIINKRIEIVRSHRLKSDRATTRELASLPYAFAEIRHKEAVSLLVPRHSSEDRRYLPFELVDSSVVVADSAISMPNVKMHEVALYASRMHLVWIATVCGKLENRYRYSNTLGWNTFPVPILTETDKNELKNRAEAIVIAREEHFPLTIAELYAPDSMPANLLQAHDDNDAVVERIYVGRRFRNDTERLEKMFDLYSKMISIEKNETIVGKNIIKRRRAPAKEA